MTIKSSSGIQDFVYQLTEAGFKRAQQHASRCNFVGARAGAIRRVRGVDLSAVAAASAVHVRPVAAGDWRA